MSSGCGSSRRRRPIVVKEAETGATLIMNNIKQRVVLKKNLAAMDRACDRVCNHITMSQRLTYKRFKQKLSRAKITYSKIMCDKEMERELRKKQMTFSYNTNYGQDPEDEEVLQKIWNTNPNRKGLKSAPAGSSTEHRAQSTVTIARPQVLQRPDTVAAHGVLPHIVGSGKHARYISTGLQGGKDDTDDDEEEWEDEDKAHHTPADRRHLQSAPAPDTSNVTNKRNAGKNIFEEDTRPTLLQIQKDRVRQANYESKVQDLCNSMKGFKVESDRVIPDYYLVVVQTQSKDSEKVSTYRRRQSLVTEEDIQKATGLGMRTIPSMTMKRLNWDFNRVLDDEPLPAQPPATRGRGLSTVPAAAW